MHLDNEELDGLSKLQTRIIASAIDINITTVEKIITTFDKVYSISSEDKINIEKIKEIRKKGYSRIPIYYAD